MHVEPQLKAKLEPFNTIEDFKVLYTVSEIDCKPVVDNPELMKVKLDHNFNETLIQIYNMKRKMYCSAPNFRKPTKKLCLIRPGGLGQFWKTNLPSPPSWRYQKNVVACYLSFVNLVFTKPENEKNRENPWKWTRIIEF